MGETAKSLGLKRIYRIFEYSFEMIERIFGIPFANEYSFGKECSFGNECSFGAEYSFGNEYLFTTYVLQHDFVL